MRARNTRPKKAGEIVEIVQTQKDGRQIAPSRSPLKDLSVCGEVGDLTAVTGKLDGGALKGAAACCKAIGTTREELI
jgi:hypothetical protein